MSLREFDDDYLVLSPQLQQHPLSTMSLTFSNFASSTIPLSTTTTTTTTTNATPSSSTINSSNLQRRTSNFFPTNDSTAISTPNIQLSTDSFRFPPLSNSSATMIEQVTSNSASPFTTAYSKGNTTYSEPPLSPFYQKPHSVATSTISSPILNTFSQPTLNRVDYSLSNNLGNLTIQTLPTSISATPQTPKLQQQSLPQTPQLLQQRFSGFMISTGNSTTNDLQLPQPALSIWNSNSSPKEVEIPKPIIKRENRYLNKVNNPVFIPSGPIPEANDLLEETKTLLTYVEHAIDDDDDSDEHIQELSSLEKQEAKNLQAEEEGEEEDCPRIKFPSKVPYTSKNDYFVQDMVNYDLTNRYSEGYSTTFYKRNKHGYMFIRESTNTLHVHQNSWIQLKIKLPVNQKKLLIKKLKVDIKELPIWKPKA
ncbi:hypothetical protein Cantr_03328 [Candida viswanathii]|uniref:Uncharacterized protein n=1 Tax=Candida viswanathii TaxID=5486 RepID=A0A367YNI0_9ASCO|nr:hypothetical protein Cantr_03328 [Candida viswanathii]